MKRIGANFSIHHAEWINPKLSWEETLERICDLGVKVVRLSVPWSAVETIPNEHRFGLIDRAVEICGRNGAKVIICAGAKTPRWPEIHLPVHHKKVAMSRTSIRKVTELNVSDKGIGKPLLNFVAAVIRRYDINPIVEGFQIENEPLELFGNPVRSVPFSFLAEEVDLARTLTKKPLSVNMGAGLTEDINTMKKLRPKLLAQLISLPVDRIGLDLYQRGYYKKLLGAGGFEATDEQWRQVVEYVNEISGSGKEPIVAELQSEPWEAEPSKVDLSNPEGNKSFTPADFKRIAARVTELNCETILLWGLEFQVACSCTGNEAWLQVTREFIADWQ